MSRLCKISHSYAIATNPIHANCDLCRLGVPLSTTWGQISVVNTVSSNSMERRPHSDSWSLNVQDSDWMPHSTAHCEKVWEPNTRRCPSTESVDGCLACAKNNMWTSTVTLLVVQPKLLPQAVVLHNDTTMFGQNAKCENICKTQTGREISATPTKPTTKVAGIFQAPLRHTLGEWQFCDNNQTLQSRDLLLYFSSFKFADVGIIQELRCVQ